MAPSYYYKQLPFFSATLDRKLSAVKTQIAMASAHEFKVGRARRRLAKLSSISIWLGYSDTGTMRYFEDFQLGQELPLATYQVERAEMIAFAAEFDPQPFHLDELAASDTILGGLAASGWHSCAVFMRMLYDGWLHDTASMGSPGVDTLKWVRPVRPGDVLSGRSVVLETRPSKSKPDRGFVRCRHEVVNGQGDLVLTMENPIMLGRRPA